MKTKLKLGSNLFVPHDVWNNVTKANQIKPTNSKDLEILVHKVEQGFDERTSLMIRNIPNKFDQKSFLTIININFKGLYDFFYLPIDSMVC